MSKPILLIANQRSGTNFLRRALASTDQFSDYDEVFHLKGPGAYWQMYNQLVEERPNLAFPTEKNVIELFDRFFLSQIGDDKTPYALIDVKYNSAHHLNTIWHSPVDSPFLLNLANRHDFPVIHLVRKNVLETYASLIIANRSQVYVSDSIAGEKPTQDVGAITLDPVATLKQIERRTKEIEMYRQWFNQLRLKQCFELDYEGLKVLNDGIVPTDFADTLSELGVDASMNLEVKTRKISKPLSAQIKNYTSDIVPMLQGTKFEYLLE